MDWTAICVLLCALGQCFALFAGDIFQNVHKLNKQGIYPEITSNTHFNTLRSSLRPHNSHERVLRKRFIFNKLQYAKSGYPSDLKESVKQVFIYPALLTATKRLLDTIHDILRSREWDKDETSSTNEALADNNQISLDLDQEHRQDDEGEEYSDVGSVGDLTEAIDSVRIPPKSPWNMGIANREQDFQHKQPTDDDFLYVSKHADSSYEKKIADLLDAKSVENENEDVAPSANGISLNQKPLVSYGTESNFDGFYPVPFHYPNIGTSENIDSLKPYDEDKQQPHSETHSDPFQQFGNQVPSTHELGDPLSLHNLLMPHAASQKHDAFFPTEDVHMPPAMFDPEYIQFDGLPGFPSVPDDENPEYFGMTEKQEFPGFLNFDLPPNYPQASMTPEDNMAKALEHANRFGMASEGAFLDPMTACQDVDGQHCSSDTDCSCYGMFSCIQGQCGMDTAMFQPPPIQDDTEDDGMWLSEPFEKEGIAY